MSLSDFSPALKSIARHVATAAAGYLVAKGTISASDSQVFTGVFISALAYVWSLAEKYDISVKAPAVAAVAKTTAALAVVMLAAGGCTAAQNAGIVGFEATALKGIQSAEDNNIALWKTDACGTPFSAVVRNSQVVPGLVQGLSALCVPNADKGNPANLLTNIPAVTTAP